MKRSIKRLPKRTQEELAVLQELILSNLTNVRMIILYGSYARGKYVIWDETYDERGVTTYYQSDLDILVILLNLPIRQLLRFTNLKRTIVIQ
jgi:uncharacterized protein